MKSEALALAIGTLLGLGLLPYLPDPNSSESATWVESRFQRWDWGYLRSSPFRYEPPEDPANVRFE